MTRALSSNKTRIWTVCRGGSAQRGVDQRPAESSAGPSPEAAHPAQGGSPPSAGTCWVNLRTWTPQAWMLTPACPPDAALSFQVIRLQLPGHQSAHLRKHFKPGPRRSGTLPVVASPCPRGCKAHLLKDRCRDRGCGGLAGALPAGVRGQRRAYPESRAGSADKTRPSAPRGQPGAHRAGGAWRCPGPTWG